MWILKNFRRVVWKLFSKKLLQVPHYVDVFAVSVEHATWAGPTKRKLLFSRKFLASHKHIVADVEGWEATMGRYYARALTFFHQLLIYDRVQVCHLLCTRSHVVGTLDR